MTFKLSVADNPTSTDELDVSALFAPQLTYEWVYSHDEYIDGQPVPVYVYVPIANYDVVIKWNSGAFVQRMHGSDTTPTVEEAFRIAMPADGTYTLSLHLSQYGGAYRTIANTTVDIRAAGGALNLAGSAASETLVASAFGDILSMSLGADVVAGGAGADRINGGGGDDVLSGDDGDDRLNGEQGADWLYGGEGDDTLAGGDGADALYGGGGRDSLAGGEGDDSLYGGAGDDVLYASAGQDHYEGGEGRDVIVFAAFATDLAIDLSDYSAYSAFIRNEIENAIGGSGDDQIRGTAYDNRLTGGAGDDTLDGSGGKDQLEGGDGADRLVGGSDDDLLIGGAGADVFVFHASIQYARPGLDRIVDFEAGFDTIELKQGAFLGGMRAGESVNFYSSPTLPAPGAMTGTAGVLIHVAGNGMLYWDQDGGAGPMAPVAFARLTNLAPLSASDFTVVV